MDNFEYVESFIEMLAAERAAALNTIHAYKRDIIELIRYLKGVRLDIQNVTAEDLTRYTSHLYAKNLSAKSLARKLSVIRQFFDFLVQEEVCAQNPGLHLRQPTIGFTLPKALSQQNVFALIEEAYKNTSPEGLRTAAMLEILYATGLRISELVTLKTQSLERNPSDYSLHQHLLVKGKGNKERLVLLNQEAIKILEKYLAVRELLIPKPHKTDWLFPSMDHKGYMAHMTRQRFGQILKELACAAGIPLHLISPHKIRHSFATHMLENGANLKILQELLGHADISSTQIYTKVTKKRAMQTVLNKHPLTRS